MPSPRSAKGGGVFFILHLVLQFAGLGPLAHLVERFHGMEEASGSNPLGSTLEKSAGFDSVSDKLSLL